MSALQPQPIITTLEEYEALSEDTKAEVFDGQIYYMVSPSQIHQSILLELCPLLNSYVKSQNGNCKVFLHHHYKTFQSPPHDRSARHNDHMRQREAGQKSM